MKHLLWYQADNLPKGKKLMDGAPAKIQHFVPGTAEVTWVEGRLAKEANADKHDPPKFFVFPNGDKVNLPAKKYFKVGVSAHSWGNGE